MIKAAVVILSGVGLAAGLGALAPAKAHCFSTWNYPRPQKGCGGARETRTAYHPAVRQEKTRAYYVELVAPTAAAAAQSVKEPPMVLPAVEPFDQRTPEEIKRSDEHDGAVAQNKDELNTLLHKNPLRATPWPEVDQRTPQQIMEGQQHDDAVNKYHDQINALMKLLHHSEGE